MIKFKTREEARQFKSSLSKNKQAKVVDLGSNTKGNRWGVKVL